MTVTLTVLHDTNEETRLEVEPGANLREVLLEAGLSPYTRWTRQLNCGGRGLCATCGVRLQRGAPEPHHWHDRAAARWGYPRLSCQITIREPMTVALLEDKIIWGGRRPEASTDS